MVGLLEYKCSICGINTWLNKPLTLQLDHINGDNRDNRIEILRLLCPNCHSQTDNFCGKKYWEVVKLEATQVLGTCTERCMSLSFLFPTLYGVIE